MKIGILWSLLGVLAGGSWHGAHAVEATSRTSIPIKKTNASTKTRPQLALQLGHKFHIADIAYAPDGKLFASVAIRHDDTACEVKIWDGQTGTLWRTLSSYASDVTVLTFAADSQTLITGGTEGVVRMWNPYTGQLLRQLPKLGRHITAIAVSPDGRHLAVGADDGSNSPRERPNGILRIWDRVAWRVKETMPLLCIVPRKLVFNKKSQLLGCAAEAEFRVWNLPSRRWMHRVEKEGAEYRSIAFSPNGTYLAVGGANEVAVWSTKFNNGKPRIMEGKYERVNNLAFLPDSKTVLAATNYLNSDNCIVYWDVKSGRKVREFSQVNEDVQHMALSPDGELLAAGGEFGKFGLWNMRSGKWRSRTLDIVDAVNQLAFSPDGQTLVSGNEDGTLRWWNLKNGRLERTVNENVGAIASVAFSSEGSHIYSLGHDQKLQGWKVKNGPFQQILSHDVPHDEAMILSADNSLVATLGGEEKSVRIWNAQTGKLLQYIIGHKGYVTSAAFSPDNKVLADAGDDGSVKIFDIAEGICLRELKPLRPMTALAYSPDGKYLISGDLSGELYVWNAQNGVLIRQFRGNMGAVHSLQFVPNAGLVSVGTTGIVQWWNVETGKVLRAHQFSQPELAACSISRDGRRAAWADSEGIVHLVDLKAGKELLSLIILPFSTATGEDSNEVSANWISYTPSGYYVASPKASTYIRWRDGLDLKPASAFKSYSRPDIVAGALHGN